MGVPGFTPKHRSGAEVQAAPSHTVSSANTVRKLLFTGPVAPTVARQVEPLAEPRSPAACFLLVAGPAVSSSGHCGGTLMAKARTHFTCQSCGFQSAKWLGRCPDCSGWNTLRGGGRASRGPPAGVGRLGRLGPAGEAGRRRGRSRGAPADGHRRAGPGARRRRGARVAGAARGDPGIGKSTLLLAALDRLARAKARCSTSPARNRCGRPRCAPTGSECRASAVHLFAETDAEKVLAAAEALRPAALVVDSIQTMFLAELGSAPGTLTSGARGRRAADGLRQALGSADLPRRPRDEGRRHRRARACSSTWWTRSSTSRASAATRSASCARTRTGSAPPTRSASSR